MRMDVCASRRTVINVVVVDQGLGRISAHGTFGVLTGFNF